MCSVLSYHVPDWASKLLDLLAFLFALGKWAILIAEPIHGP